jgi:hypothetical protein
MYAFGIGAGAGAGAGAVWADTNRLALAGEDEIGEHARVGGVVVAACHTISFKNVVCPVLASKTSGALPEMMTMITEGFAKPTAQPTPTVQTANKPNIHQ